MKKQSKYPALENLLGKAVVQKALKPKTKKQKTVKIYCDECSSEDKIRLAKYHCATGCGFAVCQKHEIALQGECG